MYLNLICLVGNNGVKSFVTFFLISKKVILKKLKKAKTTQRIQRGEQKEKEKKREKQKTKT